jgi:hypothetical protein
MGAKQEVGCFSRFDFVEKHGDRRLVELFDRVFESAVTQCGAKVLSGGPG